MSLLQLQKAGILKYLISQNCDGLIRRSGFPPSNLSELHGNSNLESCKNCNMEYLRDFDATASYAFDTHDHRTGRRCLKCGGLLQDTIINFGENLPPVPLQKAYDNSDLSELHLVLGSSLTVTPACTNPKRTVQHGGKLVICNLQKTPLDDRAFIRIYARCDDLMKLVMQKLGLEIPPFILSRTIEIKHESNGDIIVGGIDSSGIPATFLRKIEIGVPNLKGTIKSYTPNGETAEHVDSKMTIKLSAPCDTFEIRCHFWGHYNEPNLEFTHHMKGGTQIYKLKYNPLSGEWRLLHPFTNEGAAAFASMEKDIVLATPAAMDTNESEKGKEKIDVPADHQHHIILMHEPPYPSLMAGCNKCGKFINGTLVYHCKSCGNYDECPDCGENSILDSGKSLAELDIGGYIAPTGNCPHVKEINPNTSGLTVHKNCKLCPDSKENWLCLVCQQVFCSRYVKGHMKAHNTETNHAIAISFSDFSIWCYKCDNYIRCKEAQGILKVLYKTKFGDK